MRKVAMAAGLAMALFGASTVQAQARSEPGGV